MIIRGISIRLKLLLATLVTLVLLVALSFVIMDASNRLSKDNLLLVARSDMLSEMHSLEYTQN